MALWRKDLEEVRFLAGREGRISNMDWHWDCIFQVEFLLKSLKYIVFVAVVLLHWAGLSIKKKCLFM